MRNYNQEFDHLINSLGELLQTDTTATQEYLKEHGFDSYVTGTEGALFLKKLLVKAKLEQKNQEQINVIIVAKQKLAEYQRKIGGDIRQTVANLLSSGNKQEFKPLWNNLKSIDEKDLIDMLDEAQLLEIVEKIKSSDQLIIKDDN